VPPSEKTFALALDAFRAGRFQESERLLQTFLKREPSHLGAINVLAMVLIQRGRYREAEPLLQRAVRAGPASDATLYNYGVALRFLRRPAEAVERFSAALALNGTVPDTWNERGMALNDLRRHEEALRDFERAIALRKDYREAHLNRGKTLVALSRHEEAVAAFDQAVALFPDFAEAWVGRGSAHVRLRNDGEAMASFDRALQIRPDMAEAWLGRGSVLGGLRRREEAIEAYDRALALKPDLVEAWAGRGDQLAELGRLDEAIADYDRAIAINPDYARAYVEKSLCLLVLGRFAEGWPFYEWRRRMKIKPEDLQGVSEAVGRDDLAGRKVAVLSEQGVGDEIMFASILPDLIGDAAAITYQVDPRLVTLFRRAFPGVTFVSRAAPGELRKEEHDVVIWSGGLGHAYRLKDADFPRSAYLKADPAVTARFAQDLRGRTDLFTVGISWRGGTPATNGERRSLALDQLAPLLGRSDCTFVSLQYGDVSREVSEFNDRGGRIVLYDRETLDDFDNLAGLIEALDLIISVQNTTVHLSGALGKTCLAMLPFVPEWRYGLAGRDMIWYRSVELYRQARSDDWSNVIAEVGERLAAAIAAKRA
jgi:tetratricopeptide (TPR) repeat protein